MSIKAFWISITMIQTDLDKLMAKLHNKNTWRQDLSSNNSKTINNLKIDFDETGLNLYL